MVAPVLRVTLAGGLFHVPTPERNWNLNVAPMLRATSGLIAKPLIYKDYVTPTRNTNTKQKMEEVRINGHF
ncbi:hypothetical protein OCA5_c19790 [Afipia carboxidovorans OM5]|uniref:Uncharacterized protein n=1 Tax=Afipia carboxidovorans (strain ATCC 49405 / DSM 1227 / KCTC 32145 / OM5) TaxID=504832 RepID=F8BVI4_AFIC5|nr:hypothetical protein OCA4_c19780 [Afipia carboxidovorans OM4]AEI06689.1 hypothetical protein OCA5_c19790 [Afipia carboxidovorans OM5]